MSTVQNRFLGPRDLSLTDLLPVLCSARLPDYEAVSANVKSFRDSTQGWRMECLCHRPTTKELEAVYGSDLKADKEDEYGHENNRIPPWALKATRHNSAP